jgi:hypothetical protein
LKEAGAEGLSCELLNRNVNQPFKYVATWLIDAWSKIGLHVTQRVIPDGPLVRRNAQRKFRRLPDGAILGISRRHPWRGFARNRRFESTSLQRRVCKLSVPLNPATGAMLYALELPPEGGMTSWVDLCAAYAGLPDRLKRAVEGRCAVFDYVKRLAGYHGVDRVISEEAKRKTPPILHPLVHAHPVTGRKALYLDSTTTIRIEGMDEASGSVLLQEIYEFATRPEFVYRHRWQVGDALLWDNGFTMHRREPFDPSARRLMKRTTIFLSRERHIVPEGSLVAA